MVAFKPAYLIHGDDHGRIAERRARLREVAERESGVSGAEVLEGEASTPRAVAATLAAMTIVLGRRFVIVDGAERFKDAEVRDILVPALAELPRDTTVAFFAREEGRAKAPPALVQAVQAAGGEVSQEANVKPWELVRWAREQARRLSIEVDAGAARALVAHVGERQQRLLRELEKLALEAEPGASITVEDVDRYAADSAERRVWSLADALVARDAPAAVRLYLSLRAQGERLPGLLYWMTQRVRLAHEAAQRMEAGESPAQVRRSLRMPPKAAEAFLADVRRSDPERLRRAIERLADLELESRGATALDEDTAALRAIEGVAG